MSGPKAKGRRVAANAHERGYIEGRRATMRRLMNQCAIEMGFGDLLKDPAAKLALAYVALDEIRSKLRELCGVYGDNDWADNLNLTDVLEKHLGRHLDETARRHGEPRR